MQFDEMAIETEEWHFPKNIFLCQYNSASCRTNVQGSIHRL